MKKWFMFILIFLTILMIGCSSNFSGITFKDTDNFKTLTKVTYPTQEKKYLSIEEGIISSINEFSNITSKEIFAEKRNEIYSPISLYMALAMVLEGSKDEAKEELMSLLNVSDSETISNELKKIYENVYYKNEYGQMRMANSLWISNNNYEVEDNYINTLETSYYADIYNTNFDAEANQNICDWINNYTNDLLDLNPDNYPIDSNLVFLLLNTIYFDNKWSEDYNKNDTYDDKFYGETEEIVSYMTHTLSSLYFNDKKYEVVYDYFKNDNHIAYILPKEGYSVSEILNDDVILKYRDLETNYVELTLSTPKVKYNSQYDLKENLQHLGLNDIFIANGNLTMVKDENIHIDFVKQNATIEFNEDGVKAAAVTSIGAKDTAIAPGTPITIVLNRPFIYIIYNSNNIPLFVGVVNTTK